MNAAMEARREEKKKKKEKERQSGGEKVSSPAGAPSNRIPFKGTETPDNLLTNTTS